MRLRELAWVDDCVTAPVAWGFRSGHLSITGAMGPSMSWDPWPRPAARAAVGMQECTQIGEDGLST